MVLGAHDADEMPIVIGRPIYNYAVFRYGRTDRKIIIYSHVKVLSYPIPTRLDKRLYYWECPIKMKGVFNAPSFELSQNLKTIKAIIRKKIMALLPTLRCYPEEQKLWKKTLKDLGKV